MPTGYGTIYNDGVKYLKINKFDANGTDKSDYLAQMTSIRINHGDVGTLQYAISTTQVQNDYFIFGLTYPQPTTSSIGDINNYTFTASSSFAGYSISQSYSSSVPMTNYTNISGNSLGFFNPTTGLYTSGQTPNASLNAAISYQVSNPNASTKKFRLYIGSYEDITRPIDYTEITITSGSSLTGTATFNNINPYIVENQILFFGIYESSNTLDTPLVLTSFTARFISQAPAAFNGSSSLVIFDPDQINFDYNNYNPLLGNAETPQYSTVWMDVDYSQNPLTPVNFGLILSGTADRAFVQDSNYSSKAWSNLRYNGSRTNSYRII